MRTLVTLGLGALATYFIVHARGVARKRAIRNEPEAGQASETPQGAQHLGR
jgi:hypothetical protein